MTPAGRQYHVYSSEEKKAKVTGLLGVQEKMEPNLSIGGFQHLSSVWLALSPVPSPSLDPMQSLGLCLLLLEQKAGRKSCLWVPPLVLKIEKA